MGDNGQVQECELKLQLMHYWHCGTGKGSGSHVDAVVDLDEDGLPFVSGRMLKGLLRDAVYRTTVWNSAGIGDVLPAAEEVVNILFGSAAFGAPDEFGDRQPIRDTQSGLIRIGNAAMTEEDKAWLAAHPSQRQLLFREIYSTALHAESRVAKKGSLRGQQVVIPLTLNSKISIDLPPGQELADFTAEQIRVYENGFRLLGTALPLLTALGSGRSRGLGRVLASLEVVS